MDYTMRDVLPVRETTELALLDFVVPSEEKDKVLVIEGGRCLAQLREKLPQAEIFAVSVNKYAAEDYPVSGVEFLNADYTTEPLDFAEKTFDYIIAPRALELCGNPQDIAAGIGQFLKDTGFLLTSFLNIRYWKIIRELRDGHFFYFCRHMYTKEEMDRFLCASFYKDTVFAPIKNAAPQDFLQQLLDIGFENRRDDLETEIWLVKAGRSTPEIAALKSLYTPQIRKELARLLHRVEYDVERERSLIELQELCEKENIFADYLAEFMAQTVVHYKVTGNVITKFLKQNGKSSEAEILERIFNE